MIPIITSIHQFSLETLPLIQGDIDKEYIKLARDAKYLGYFSIVLFLVLPALLALMFIFKESNYNWTTPFIFVICMQSLVEIKKKSIQLKMDIVKLAAFSSDKLKLIS